jgi:hypothetical protein
MDAEQVRRRGGSSRKKQHETRGLRAVAHIDAMRQKHPSTLRLTCFDTCSVLFLFSLSPPFFLFSFPRPSVLVWILSFLVSHVTLPEP